MKKKGQNKPGVSQGRRRRITSLVNLKTAIEKTMVDLNVHMNTWVQMMAQLEEQSREKDPDLLQNVREQIISLREVIQKEDLELMEVYSLVGQCDNNVMALVDEVREIKRTDFEDFMAELNDSIRICQDLLRKTEELDSLGSENHKLLLQYANKVLANLLAQKQKLEKICPIMFPRLPDVQKYVDKQKNFKKAEFCKELDIMVQMFEDRLRELGVEPRQITEILVDMESEADEPLTSRGSITLLH